MLLVNLLTPVLSNIIIFFMDDNSWGIDYMVISSVVVGLIILMIMKSDRVVDVLNLDKGFDDSVIELGNLKAEDIIKIGTFIIGGLLLVNNLPKFLSYTYFAFKGSIIAMKYDIVDNTAWGISALNVIVGYLLITNYEFVVKVLKVNK